MNVIATALKHLIAAGVTGDALVTAVTEIEDALAAKRGTAKTGAERMAALRERRKAEAMCDESDVTPSPPSLADDQKGFDKEKSPTPPKEITSQKSNPVGARAKTPRKSISDLPDDFEPNPATWAVADDCGFTEREVFAEVEKIRDWAKNADGSKGRKADWQAFTRNWLKRAKNDRRNPPASERNSLQNALSAIDIAADEAIRRTTGYGPEGGEANPDKLSRLWESAA